MFSWEIDELIKRKSGTLSPQEYLDITDIRHNPQIVRVKYDPYKDRFDVSTKDGYAWNIKVKIE